MRKKARVRLSVPAGIALSSAFLLVAAAALAKGNEQLTGQRDTRIRGVPALPDLQVREISLTKLCDLQVTIVNDGKAGVPKSAYAGSKEVIIRLSRGGGRAFSISLKEFDHQYLLRSPGGSATYIWSAVPPPKDIGLISNQVKVVVDAGNALRESDETNNELTRQVICKAKASITITRIDPTLQDLICWYHQNPPNKFKCIVFWKTVNYSNPKIRKIVLICKMFSPDGHSYSPCSSIYTIAMDVPNSGEYHFDLPYTSESIGDFALKIYGYSGVESPEYPVCIW